MSYTQTISDTTHLLDCCHAVGRKNRTYYSMHCLILKDMTDGRSKVLVFGDRNWANRDDRKRVRYVKNSKLRSKSS